MTGFIASLLVHLLTFAGINAADYVSWVWVLHLGIFVGIIPLIGKDLRSEVLAPMPRWAKVAVIFFTAYAVINFILFIVLSTAGAPDIWDGKYVLHRHGSLIRELSEREYHLQQAYVLRGFSGHWMFFYLVPTLHSWYRND